MHKSLLSSAVSLSLATFAVVATLAPTASRYSNTEAAPLQDQVRTNQAQSGPTILAQGRCFNGKCY